MQPLLELSTRGENDQLVEDTNADFHSQGCHAFYADIIPDHHISTVGKYSSLSADVLVPILGLNVDMSF